MHTRVHTHNHLFEHCFVLCTTGGVLFSFRMDATAVNAGRSPCKAKSKESCTSSIFFPATNAFPRGTLIPRAQKRREVNTLVTATSLLLALASRATYVARLLSPPPAGSSQFTSLASSLFWS